MHSYISHDRSRSVKKKRETFNKLAQRYSLRSTSKFIKSAFYFATKRDAGCQKNRFTSSENVTNMILNREKGQLQYERFSNANKCKIYNNFLPNTMETLHTYGNYSFTYITCSQDGKVFIAVSANRKVRFYDERYKLIKEVFLRGKPISDNSAAFSLSKKYLAYKVEDAGIIHLYPVVDGVEKRCLRPLECIRPCDFMRPCLTFSADGKELLGATDNGLLYIYDLNERENTLELQTHQKLINTVSFSDNSSQVIYSGCEDGIIKIFDRRGLSIQSKCCQPVGTLTGHRNSIIYICPKGDGRHLISQGMDNCIKLWDVRRISSRSPSASARGMLHEDDTCLMTYRGHTADRVIPRCGFSPVETTGQRYIYTGCYQGGFYIYDTLTGEIIVKKNGYWIRDLTWHPNKNEILVSYLYGILGRWTYSNND